MPFRLRKASRRATAWTMAFCLILIFSACSGAEPTPAATSTEPISVSTEPPVSSASPSDSPSDAKESPSDYYKPFSPPITVSVARITNPAITLPKDMTWDDNVWTNAYQEMLGVTFETIWSGESNDFSIALDTMIASGDLPDYMNLKYDDFYKLMQKGLLEPIDKQVDAYATPQVRAALDAYDGAARKVASADGHLLGITAAPPRDGTMLWIRDDWFAASGKSSLPTTFEEVIELAYEFAGKPAQGDETTVGFGLSQILFMGENGAGLGLDGVFSAFGVYPMQWVEQDGKLIHGSIDPAVKPVLELLQKWYSDGIIASNFDEIDRWEGIAQQEIFKERVGMVFGAEWFGEHYAPNLMDIKQELSPTWTCIPIPGVSGTANHVPTIARQGDVTCIRAGFAYPELPIRMVNVTRALLNGELASPEFKFVLEENMQRDTSILSMASGGHMTDAAGNLSGTRSEIATAIAAAISGSKEALSTQDTQYIYDRCMAWQNNDNTNAVDYRLFVTFAPGGSQSVLADMRARGLFQANAYYGPETIALNEAWTTLSELLNEAYTNIIKGANVDTAFDRYVQAFNDNGGDACTRDVNTWYASMNP